MLIASHQTNLEEITRVNMVLKSPLVITCDTQPSAQYAIQYKSRESSCLYQFSTVVLQLISSYKLHTILAKENFLLLQGKPLHSLRNMITAMAVIMIMASHQTLSVQITHMPGLNFGNTNLLYCTLTLSKEITLSLIKITMFRQLSMPIINTAMVIHN